MRIAARLLAAGAAVACLVGAGSASAVTVDWVDWTVGLPGGQIDGVITTPGGPVSVAFNGHQLYAQITGGGPDNWVDDGYAQGVVNRPPGTDIVMLGGGGAETITFGQAVTDPYVAFADWSRVTAQFSAPFTVVSQGCGVNGCGLFSPNPASDGFTGVGDVYGVVQFHGAFDQLTFTDTAGGPHGFRVGLAEPSGAPEPASWALMILGFGGLGATLRRRRAAPA